MATELDSTVGITPANESWIAKQHYRDASTDLIIRELKGLRDYCVDILKLAPKETKSNGKQNRSHALLYATLSCVGSLDPTKGLDKREKRSLVENYINRSYPYWVNISSHNPLMSIELLLYEIGDKMKNYKDELKVIYEMASDCLNIDHLNHICATTQKIITYCIYYVHVKRFPYVDVKGEMQYKKHCYLPCVNLPKWAEAYSLILN